MKPGRILASAVSLALIGYILVTLDISAIAAQYAEIVPEFVFGALVLMVLNLLAGTARLVFLVRYVSRVSIAFTDLLRANVAGLLSSLFVPNLIGSVVGRYVLLRRNGLTVGDIASLVTIERLLLVLVGGSLLVVGWVAVLGVGTLSAIAGEVALPQIIGGLVLAVAFLFAAFRWKREADLVRSILSLKSLLRTAWLVTLTLAGQGLMLVVYLFCTKSLGLQDVNPWKFLAVAAIVSFAAGLPFSINGWGVREIAAIFAFEHVGIEAPEAVAISVLVGILSTCVILIAAPSLFLSRPPISTDRLDDETLANTTVKSERARWKIIMIAGLGVGLLIFITIHVPIQNTLITMNFGDPFAILAFILCLVSWLGTRRPPFTAPAAFSAWIAALTAVIAIGFAIGAGRFGVTDWAMNNRFLGWGVILGYTGLGAMIVSTLGRHGLRQLCEVILASGAAIVWFTVIYPRAGSIFGWPVVVDGNFNGFSSNRNTFAFQLLIALSGALAYSRVMARHGRTWCYCFLAGSVIFGILRTYSLAGIGTGALLLAFAALLGLADRIVVLRAVAIAVLLWMAVKIDTQLFGWQNVASGSFSSISDGAIANNSLVERFLSMSEGLALWREHPIFGAGLGAFVNLDLGERGQPLVIHSVYIWLLAEFGAIGFVIAASLPVAVAIAFARSRLTTTPPAAVLLIACGATFLIFGAVHDIAYQRLFWMVLGAVAAGYGFRPRRIPLAMAG